MMVEDIDTQIAISHAEGRESERDRCLQIVGEVRRGYEQAKQVMLDHGDKDQARQFGYFVNLCDSITAQINRK